MLRRPPTLLAHFVALMLTAVLLALSYPLPGWGFLAWVALVPAGWLAATSRSGWRLTWTSAVVFGAWWVWMLRWLWPVTPPGSIATAWFQSLFWVAALWATNVCVRRQRVPVAIALPLCWVALEYVRCTWPWGGFAWFTLAQTQAAWETDPVAPVVPQVSVWLGAWGAGLWLACVNGLLASAAVGQLFFRDARLKRDVRRVPALIALALVGGLTVSLFVTPDFSSREASATPVAVVQMNSPHSNKLAPTVATYEADFAVLERLHAEAAGRDDFLPSLGEGPGAGADVSPESGTLPQPLPGGGESATSGGPVLIVWPETSVPGKFNEEAQWAWERWAAGLPEENSDAERVRVMVSMARRAKALVAKHGVPTMVGGSTEIETTDPKNPVKHNSAFLVGGDGEVVGRYDKMHRVPFGEYIPLPEELKKWVLATVSPYDFDYSIAAGSGAVVFEVGVSPGGGGGLRFATPICFEDTDGALCRSMVYEAQAGHKRVDVLVNLTTNGWFGRLPSEQHPEGGLAWRSMRYQHLQLASLRAIENRVAVVRAVNTGCSAIIDSTGRVVAVGEPGRAMVVRGEVVVDGRRTLYATVGDWPIRGLSAVALAVVLAGRCRRPAMIRRRVARLGMRASASSAAAVPSS